MKALVVGASGFVGDYLIDAIKEDMLCDVYATKLPQHKAWRDDITVLDLNILDARQVQDCLNQVEPDYIFYLAAQSSIAKSWADPPQTVQVNVQGSLNVLDAIRTLRNSPRVLIVGSGEEYGAIPPEAVPIPEETLLNPQNIYAATKACQNMMASIYAAAYGLQLIMVRAFNHMGPGQMDIFVISDFCHQAARIEAGLQEPVIRVGNLQARRDFTDVRDVVRAYTRLIQFGRAGETYNVGSGHAITIQSALDTIIQKSKKDISVFVDPQKLRPIDVPVIEADIQKLYAATGWQPCIPFEQTIEEMLDYWRKQCEREKMECVHS